MDGCAVVSKSTSGCDCREFSERAPPVSKRYRMRSRELAAKATRKRPQGVKRRRVTCGTPCTAWKVEEGVREEKAVG